MTSSGISPRAAKYVAAIAIAVLLSAPMTAMADAAAGLDLTMQVLGKNDKVDDRLVNRILVPGIGTARGGQRAAGAQDRSSAREERQTLREENREARKEQREEALESFRERRDRSE